MVLGGHCSFPFPSGHIYNVNENSWVKQFVLPSGRSYHSTILYKDKYAIIFGGMGPYDVSRKARPCYNTINIVDMHSYQTRVLKIRGEEYIPSRRSHSCVMMGKYMLVFGGLTMKKDSLKDLVYLDLKELKWYQKEYLIDSQLLSLDMEKGIAHHKGVAHFDRNKKTLPFYSSEYQDHEGIYYFGGIFGNGNENTVMMLGLNTYHPRLKRVPFSGTPPSSVNTIL